MMLKKTMVTMPDSRVRVQQEQDTGAEKKRRFPVAGAAAESGPEGEADHDY